MITVPAATTALLLVDLQKGIVGLPTAPYSGDAVLSRAKALAQRFRAAKAPVVLINVAFAPDFSDALKAPVDRPMQAPPGGFPEGWTELAEGLAEPSDIRVTKRQWGAFYGTDLDLQLRRRGVTTVVLGGIATNMGVEFDRPRRARARLRGGAGRGRRDHLHGRDARLRFRAHLPPARPGGEERRDRASGMSRAASPAAEPPLRRLPLAGRWGVLRRIMTHG